MNPTSESAKENGTVLSPKPDEQTKPAKRANVGKRRAHVAPKPAKSAKKAGHAKKAATGRKKASSARAGSKTAKILDLLKTN